ncbi:hypothetical protein LUZ62_072562 [Rhynchospora pubera]|uniref:Uncharacterized protein n=1 Tax=Rhynchospora pubera TaxID=906938 RepID=A0AAV8D1E8_9POAL|nr:hypothetical protein LUZ62_072562 [Rhynchospora pubera]
MYLLFSFPVQIFKFAREEFNKMASNYVEGETEGKFDRHHLSPKQGPSPRTMGRSWSSNSSTCSQGSAPKCVCAPATHANSFKCRLHRTPPGPTSPTAKPPPAVSNNTAHRTVEAQ